MHLRKILGDVEYQLMQGMDDIEISQLAYHTKKVGENALFICLAGAKFDGHNFALEAISKGAKALLVSKDLHVPSSITVIKVADTRKVLAKIADNFFENPARAMNLIGITGTNGKTSTSIIISTILESIQHKVGVIGTIDNRVGQKVIHVEKTTPTTPDAIELSQILYHMRDEQVTDVVLEVSSMGLQLHRVDACNFKIGIFTNLSPEHLDDHLTMENYKNAKMRLFELCQIGVVNIDDPVGQEIIEKAATKVYTYGIDKPADFRASEIIYHAGHVVFTLEHQDITRKVIFRMPGKFSVYNALASIAACYYLGHPLDVALEGLAAVVGVRGRFEKVDVPANYTVIVDYAHTPGALENILNTIKLMAQARIITVFGAPGDRDRSKRPLMGEIAGRLSDYCIITSDDPRTEDPEQILTDVEVGLRLARSPYSRLSDRKEAIYAALKMAEENDIILIAGKGHETVQIFKDKTVPFNDVEVVQGYYREILVS